MIRRYVFGFVVATVIDFIIVAMTTGYNKYTGDISLGDGLSFIGSLFGGTLNILIALGVLAGLVGIYIVQRMLSKSGHHNLLPLMTIIVAVAAAFIGVSWLHFSFGMFVPVLVILFLLGETALFARIFGRRS